MTTPQIAIASPATSLADHKHCESCGKSIATDGRVCSPACETRLREAIRVKKRSVYILMGVILLTVLFSLYGGQLLGRGTT